MVAVMRSMGTTFREGQDNEQTSNRASVKGSSTVRSEGGTGEEQKLVGSYAQRLLYKIVSLVLLTPYSMGLWAWA